MKVLFISAAILALSAPAIKSDVGNNELNPFISSLMLIEKINNDPESTWKAGQNFDSNLPASYINRLAGLKRSKQRPLQRQQMLTGLSEDSLSIPQSFDSRKQWTFCKSLQQIRDQGDCGSCWAVAGAATFTDRLCIATKGKFNGHLSAEEVMSCCTTCGHGCGGGDDGAAWDYFKSHGIVTGGDYNSSEGCIPYSIVACEHHMPGPRPQCGSFGPNVGTPKCSKTCTNKLYTTPFEKDHHKVVSAYTVPSNVQAIQMEIMKHGPVEAGFKVHDDFLVYKSGIYHPSKHSKDIGGHAVKLIGWGEEKGIPYWLAQNSWASDWGENGLFRIVRGKNACGFESEINAGIPSTTLYD